MHTISSSLVVRAYTASREVASTPHTMAILLLFRVGSARGWTQTPACRNCALRLTLPSMLRRSRSRLWGGQLISEHHHCTSVVQKHHMWLNPMGMLVTEKVHFLYSHISQFGLFGDTAISRQSANWQRYSASAPDAAISAYLLLETICENCADPASAWTGGQARREAIKVSSSPVMSDPGRDDQPALLATRDKRWMLQGLGHQICG